MSEPSFVDAGQIPIASPISKGEQRLLFPLRALTELIKAEPSADSLGEVQACDGLWYHVKGDGNGRPIRASEWLCTMIAEAVGIGAPPASVIQLQNDDLVFGSRRLAGVADKIRTRTYLTTASKLNKSVSPLGTLLSKIYAFDMFMYNEDRHFGNYLTTEENDKCSLYAFDYSRALFWKWPWVGFPDAAQSTLQRGRELWTAHGFNLEAGHTTLDKLNSLSLTIIHGFLERMPIEWLTPELRDDFIRMWSGEERQASVPSQKFLGITTGS